MANLFRRMFWDIETSHDIVEAFVQSGKPHTLNYGSIVEHGKIICICWNWEGEDEIHSLHWDNENNDEQMIRKFVKELNTADEAVAHYGDNFDIKKFRARCIFHRIPAMSTYKTVDTWKMAKKIGKFPSNRLNDIGNYLGIGEKVETEKGLWTKVRNREKGALEKMVYYCKGDIRLLKDVYTVLKGYSEAHTHVGAALGHERWTCPYCASGSVLICTTKYSRLGVPTTQMKCKKCKPNRYYNISASVRKQYELYKLKQEKKKKGIII